MRTGADPTTRAMPWWPSKPARAVSVPPSTSMIGIRRLVACSTSRSRACLRWGTTSRRIAGLRATNASSTGRRPATSSSSWSRSPAGMGAGRRSRYGAPSGPPGGPTHGRGPDPGPCRGPRTAAGPARRARTRRAIATRRRRPGRPIERGPAWPLEIGGRSNGGRSNGGRSNGGRPGRSGARSPGGRRGRSRAGQPDRSPWNGRRSGPGRGPCGALSTSRRGPPPGRWAPGRGPRGPVGPPGRTIVTPTLPPWRLVAAASTTTTATRLSGPATRDAGLRSGGRIGILPNALGANAESAPRRSRHRIRRAGRRPGVRVALGWTGSLAPAGGRAGLLGQPVAGLPGLRPRTLAVGLSHVRPRRAVASAGRRVCPRRQCLVRPTRRGGDPTPPSREPPAPRLAHQAASQAPARAHRPRPGGHRGPCPRGEASRSLVSRRPLRAREHRSVGSGRGRDRRGHRARPRCSGRPPAPRRMRDVADSRAPGRSGSSGPSSR